MRIFFTTHRALLGIAGLVAVAAGLGLSKAGVPAAEIAWVVDLSVLLVVGIGFAAVITSPYWRIIYRESPLRRARTGVTDLDERELALRDRANGLTYYLFVAANVVALGIAAFCVGQNWWTFDHRALTALIPPYALFAVALPVIMLEWFEPSGPAAEAACEEEE